MPVTRGFGQRRIAAVVVYLLVIAVALGGGIAFAGWNQSGTVAIDMKLAPQRIGKTITCARSDGDVTMAWGVSGGATGYRVTFTGTNGAAVLAPATVSPASPATHTANFPSSLLGDSATYYVSIVPFVGDPTDSSTWVIGAETTWKMELSSLLFITSVTCEYVETVAPRV